MYIQLILVFIVVVLIARYLTKKNTYWEDRHVPVPPKVSLIRTLINIFIKPKPLVAWFQYVYHSTNARYVGTVTTGKPGLVIKDPDLLKQIMVKHFDHFYNRQNIKLPKEVDPFSGKNLMRETDQNWKNLRSILSPAFTSSKMRGMFVLMKNSSKQFIEHFSKNISTSETKPVELKNTFTRYTCDVIANCVFGIECDSLEDPENEFYVSGMQMAFTGFIKSLKIVLYILLPKLMSFLKVKIIGKKTVDYFYKIVADNVAQREKEGIVRMDMIHILMEARKGKLKHDTKTDEEDVGFATVSESNTSNEAQISEEFTIEDITSNALLFFVAGFETTATVLAFLGYELAVNPDVQAKLQAEIDETLKNTNGDLTYETLLKMKYLDMVVCEVLRLWPPGFAADRQCTKPFIIEPKSPEEPKVYIPKDMIVTIPIYCIHRDPEYWSDPEKFDPERFSDENKDNIQPYTYLPFGLGPRNCISSRFGLLEVKTIIFYLLSKFDLVVIDKTDVPFKLSKRQFSLTAANGFWVGFKKRKFEK